MKQVLFLAGALLVTSLSFASTADPKPKETAPGSGGTEEKEVKPTPEVNVTLFNFSIFSISPDSIPTISTFGNETRFRKATCSPLIERK